MNPCGKEEILMYVAGGVAYQNADFGKKVQSPNVDSNEVWENKVDLCPDSCYMDSVPVMGGT